MAQCCLLRRASSGECTSWHALPVSDLRLTSSSLPVSFSFRLRKWSSCDAKTGYCRSTLTASPKKLISFKREVWGPVCLPSNIQYFQVFRPGAQLLSCVCCMIIKWTVSYWVREVRCWSRVCSCRLDLLTSSGHTQSTWSHCAVNYQLFLNCILLLVGNKGFIGPLAALYCC